ncbi:Symplekin [Thalictrum thalictroides]|uniref:Symplekin n=1 Tax=Thalictrum thalictroides TaxID=46969 RepID=A0A7J6WIH9_THATH|nr:Symplekin [Thalictrum thalictroides]
MNAGDAADQVIRKVDKMLKNSERVSRDCRSGKEDHLLNQVSVSGDLTRKRPMFQDSEGRTSIDDLPAKRPCYGPAGMSSVPVQLRSDSGRDDVTVNGTSPKVPFLDGDLTPAEQMIAMIGALLAEGERGAESLEILISNIHPDLMADIVIANMKHLPKSFPPLTSNIGNKPVPSQALSSSTPSPFTTSVASTASLQASAFIPQVAMKITSEFTSISNPPADLKRDPRRDPRRLDPRLVSSPVGVQSIPIKEDISDVQNGFVSSMNLNNPDSLPAVTKMDDAPGPLTSKTDMELLESSLHTLTNQLIPIESMETLDDENNQVLEDDTTLDVAPSPLHSVDQDQVTSTTDINVPENLDGYVLEADQYSPVASSASASEEISHDLPSIPLYVEMTEEQKHNVSKLAVERIFESVKQIQATGYGQTRMALLARLVAQTDADADIISMLQKHTILDYQEEKGHELALYVLYYLHTIVVSASDDQSSFAATIYEKFLLAVAKSLWDKLPSSDKSFSRFLGEVPLLPESAFKLLEDLCYSDGSENHERDVRDVDRVTQGLGAVWSLILGRPLDRKACLNIALRFAVHPQDDLRTKSIRLVANKLYPLGYLSENIEQFATDMLLSVVDEQNPDGDPSQVGSLPQRMEGNFGVQETSVSGSQNSEPGASENDSARGNQQVLQSVTTVSMSQAQQQMSLFFALCTKKPSLLQLVFDIYGRAPKIIKQAVHRHIPILLKNLGSSYSELLRIISDPPQGSENLLLLVLKILTEETAPSAQLISTVKSLYETKLKDAAILIPMLSLLSKDEVLPIFSRLVDLPLEKFQAALARILQGSAHTGPALTPAEVLVAIHDINPEKDRIALKKVTDACSACFEQRTVFTQHVLAKALNQLVDQTPLPLLFMRTVIQAIDAFPSLVDFVMEILSKLVNRQIWKMPKLWVGFLKCASQTQPHSFRVLLQLPPPQLENALTRHANLRGPLASYANQPSIKSSLPRSILVILGLANESLTQRAAILSSYYSASQTRLIPAEPKCCSAMHGKDNSTRIEKVWEWDGCCPEQ